MTYYFQDNKFNLSISTLEGNSSFTDDSIRNFRIVFRNINVIEKLELSNVKTIHGRAEEIAHKEEYREKYENPNCLGSITFFSDNYISDSTKEELSIMYSANGYEKRNVMISLISLDEFDANKTLVNAISNGRISIPNANEILPVLTKVMEEEKDKLIHRYSSESDIQFIIDKIDKIFNIRIDD